MKKTVKIFITWLLITLIAIAGTPLVLSQQTPSPQPESSVNQTADATVVFDGQNLFTIKNKFGSFSPQQRQQKFEERIAEFANDYTLSIEDLEVVSTDEEGLPLSIITAGNILIGNVTEQDARMAGKTRRELTNEYLEKIRSVVETYKKQRRAEHLIRGAVFSFIATIVLILAFWITNNLFARIYQRLQVWGDTYIRAVHWGNFELIRANQLDNVITFVTKIIQAVIILGLFFLYFPFVFNQFPWTKQLANTFWEYFLGILNNGWQAFIAYLPSLLTISLVIAFTYFLIIISKPFFQELSKGEITLPGFYAEWAWPTFRLVMILIIALASVAIFPLLPGFQSPAFQGITVFLGLLISLGSTSVIANIISGSVLIYTRSFRVGDRIKVDDIFGQVIETTLLVTRILTPTNVVISIPNSQIITSSIENLNFAAQELSKPLIVRTKIYLGYEVPWRQAYEALIQAALRTEGVAKSPLPFVLQGELNEVYVTYLLNVYIDLKYFEGKTAKEFEQANSQLHENIRDCCNEIGIRIFAPSYEADPTNYGPAASDP